MEEKRAVFHDSKLKHVELVFSATEWSKAGVVIADRLSEFSLFPKHRTLVSFNLKNMAADGFVLRIQAKTDVSSLRFHFVHEDMNFSFRYTDPNLS